MNVFMTHWILIIINKNTKEALHSIAVSRTVQTCMWISKKNLKKLEINGDQQRIKNPATLMLKLYFLPPFLSKLWGLLFHFFFFPLWLSGRTVELPCLSSGIGPDNFQKSFWTLTTLILWIESRNDVVGEHTSEAECTDSSKCALLNIRIYWLRGLPLLIIILLLKCI